MQTIVLNHLRTNSKDNATIYNNKENFSGHAFKNILKKTYQTTSIPGDGTDKTLQMDEGPSVKLLALGKISAQNPTVSDLLHNHPKYSKKCWQIIHSSQNKQKAFNTIQPGTNIYINPRTDEILWKSSGQNHSRIFNKVMAVENKHLEAQLEQKEHTSSRLQYLGRISDQNPTVSSLLVKNQVYGKKCWSIIHKGENRNKPFEKLRSGSAIYIDTKSHEIHWDTKMAGPPTSRISKIAAGLPYPSPSEKGLNPGHILSDRLESSVRSYLGKPYSDLDCYELVIRGLRHAGIQYSGKNGLKYRLVQKALNEGRPTNSYLTGEGIIKTTANEVYSKTLKQIFHPDQVTQNIIKEVAPLLSNGQILSFSTPTKGHMGIISNNGSVWTFINSGFLDNQFGTHPIKKGVGEENLAAEIDNWVRLAAKRNEPLRISIGKVSGTKLATEKLTIQDKYNS